MRFFLAMDDMFLTCHFPTSVYGNAEMDSLAGQKREIFVFIYKLLEKYWIPRIESLIERKLMLNTTK